MSILENLAKEYAKKWGITVEDVKFFLEIQRDYQGVYSYGKLSRLGSGFLGIRISPRQTERIIKKYRRILKIEEKKMS